VSEGSNCDCKCETGKYGICEDFNKLRTAVDVNIADRRKWNEYFSFVQIAHRNWRSEDAWKMHLEVSSFSPS
jgi:hypothetical protein